MYLYLSYPWIETHAKNYKCFGEFSYYDLFQREVSYVQDSTKKTESVHISWWLMLGFKKALTNVSILQVVQLHIVKEIDIIQMRKVSADKERDLAKVKEL